MAYALPRLIGNIEDLDRSGPMFHTMARALKGALAHPDPRNVYTKDIIGAAACFYDYVDADGVLCLSPAFAASPPMQADVLMCLGLRQREDGQPFVGTIYAVVFVTPQPQTILEEALRTGQIPDPSPIDPDLAADLARWLDPNGSIAFIYGDMALIIGARDVAALPTRSASKVNLGERAPGASLTGEKELLDFWTRVLPLFEKFRATALELAAAEHNFFTACIKRGQEELEEAMQGSWNLPRLDEFIRPIMGTCFLALENFAASYETLKQNGCTDPLSVLIKDGVACPTPFVPCFGPIGKEEADAAYALGNAKLELIKALVAWFEKFHRQIDHRSKEMGPDSPMGFEAALQTFDAGEDLRAQSHDAYRRADRAVKHYLQLVDEWESGERQLSNEWVQSIISYIAYRNLAVRWMDGSRPM